MLENSFIKFTTALPTSCEFPIPVNRNYETIFYVQKATKTQRVDIVTESGRIIRRNAVSLDYIASPSYLRAVYNASSEAEIEGCFRFRMMESENKPAMQSQVVISENGTWRSAGMVIKTYSLMAGAYSLSIDDFDITATYKTGTTASAVFGILQVVNEDGEVIVSTQELNLTLLRQDPSVTFTLQENKDVNVIVKVTGVDDLTTPPIGKSNNITLSVGGICSIQSGDLEDIVVTGYSNALIYVGTKDAVTYPKPEHINDFSLVSYRCNEDAFGFPFSLKALSSTTHAYTQDIYVKHLLPLRCYAPQYSQKDETYEKLNGEVVTLYAKYYREWSAVTDYLPASIHDKIMAALSCDEVYINGVRVTKSDNYQIDWDNYDLDCDGVTKLARATFKVRENITQRNSN